MKISVILPTCNEEQGVKQIIINIAETLKKERIDYEIIMIDDSEDKTVEVASKLSNIYKLKIMIGDKPASFGGAIKKGIQNSTGDAVIIMMADNSDNPADLVKYYRKLEEGYDCVFGSRFISGSKIDNYPKSKLIANRLTNKFIQLLFWIEYNDVTNAFKAYKREVLENVMPINLPKSGQGFNISSELALRAIVRGHSYAILPINWHGREMGVSKMNVKKSTKKYLFTVLSIWLEKVLLIEKKKLSKKQNATLTKKILFFCYNGKSMPSSKVRAYGFAKSLIQYNKNVEVISCKDDLRAEYDGPDSNKMNHWQRLKVLLRALKRLSKEKKDTIFYIQKTGFHIIAPLLIHFIRGNKIILDYDDYEYNENSVASKIFFGMTVKSSEFCVAASRELQEFLKKFHDKVHHLPTGADIDDFPVKHTHLKSNITKIHWGGQISTEDMLENLKRIADCMKEIQQNAKLQITGDGDKLKDLQEYCKQNKVHNVEFLGWLDREKLLELLNEIDIGLMPLFQDNIYNRSKSPTKLFEYLAKGMITISCAVGEMNYIIQDGVNGFLAKNPKEFIDKISYAIKNHEQLQEIRINARKTAEKYSIQEIGKELAEIIKNSTLNLN